MNTDNQYIVPVTLTNVLALFAFIGVVAISSAATRGFLYLKKQYITNITPKNN